VGGGDQWKTLQQPAGMERLREGKRRGDGELQRQVRRKEDLRSLSKHEYGKKKKDQKERVKGRTGEVSSRANTRKTGGKERTQTVRDELGGKWRRKRRKGWGEENPRTYLNGRFEGRGRP